MGVVNLTANKMDALTSALTENKSRRKENEYGRMCVFATRTCGATSALIVLLCGLVSLLPLPSFTTSLKDYPRCLGVGFIFIICSVIMFFIEASAFGQCVDKLAFLSVIGKHLKHWHRAALYMGVSIAPLALWCLSASTIIPMIILVITGALNFVLAVGQKGDHGEPYIAAKWKKLGDEEMDDLNEEDDKSDNIDEQSDAI